MTDPATPQAVELKPLNLWLADRSRFECSVEHCRRARYLSYHAGPHGYGWQRRAQSIPTLTGTLMHDPLAELLKWTAAHDALPPDDITYSAIRVAQQQYQKIVEARGLRLTVDAEHLAWKTAEQTTLLESLIWAWVRVILPAHLEQWKILLVESEELNVVGCTCGLGSLVGTAWEHDDRGCAGIGWMTRGDFISVSRDLPLRYRYDDFKGTGLATKDWEAAWQYRVQFMAGVLGAEQRLGVTIDEAYVHALIKGRNTGEWNPEEGAATGPKYQSSRLIYAGHRAAQPPVLAEAWSPYWKGQYYVADDGKRRKQTGDFPRTGIWTMAPEQYQGCYSPSDFWTRWIGVDALKEHVRVIGPIYRRDWKLEGFLTQLEHEERRVQDGVQAVYEAMDKLGDIAHPVVQAALDQHFPQAAGSHCHQYFGDQCQHLGICNREPGWQTPELLGMIPRRPHHDAELHQAVSRGLLAPDVGLVDGAEDEV